MKNAFRKKVDLIAFGSRPKPFIYITAFRVKHLGEKGKPDGRRMKRGSFELGGNNCVLLI